MFKIFFRLNFIINLLMYSFFKPHYGFKASMESLLTSLKSQGVIHSDKVFNAMLKVDRADFCKEEPYWDR
jgi:hypothetical protein